MSMAKREPTLREMIAEVRDLVRDLRHEFRVGGAEIRARLDVLAQLSLLAASGNDFGGVKA
jgi:hypothetical protein